MLRFCKGYYKLVTLLTILVFFAGCSFKLSTIAAGSNNADENNVINVREFGAKGDGVADDTTAFQAALTALTSGQTLTIPSGIYNVSSLTVKSAAVITGEKGALVKGYGLENEVTGEGIFSIKADGVTIRNLVIDGDQKYKSAIKSKNAHNIIIEDCEIKNTYGDLNMGSFAVYLYGGSNIVIKNCYFHDISGPDNVIINDCVGLNRAIWAWDVASIAISKCTFDEIRGFGGGDCIQLNAPATDPAKLKYSDAKIEDCIFINFYMRAIKVQVSGATIINNTITSNIAADMDQNFQAAITTFGSDTVIDNNTIILHNSRLGIDVNGTNCKVTNNNILRDRYGDSKRMAGIFVSAKGSNSIVENNTIRNIPNAIEVNKRAAGVVVESNYLH
ncbi:MAG: right-handed parallel beta-helix repeat-containing protein [Pelosinus sp.]|nr:right-handed parallel beta-helix repeat-containing protein [Pelosinus sp.]